MSPVNGKMTEAELTMSLRKCAREQGWLEYHTYDSRRSTPGFPDLIAIKGKCLVVWELKDDKGKPTREQIEWLDRWRAIAEAAGASFVAIHVALIRPADLDAAYWLLMRMQPTAAHPWPTEWPISAKERAA